MRPAFTALRQAPDRHAARARCGMDQHSQMVPPADAQGSIADQTSEDGSLSAEQRELRDLRQRLAEVQSRERLLAYELQHRVRNMLAVIRSIYRRSLESSAGQQEFAAHFQGRLDAIARHQLRLDLPGSPGLDVEDLLRDELVQAAFVDGPRCRISGPPVHLLQKTAELMGLAIHELTTNSIKFGALSQNADLKIEWSVEDGPEGRRLHFRWTESGVSVAAAAPRPTGFGRRLIEDALPYQLGATTSFDLRPGGLDCVIVLPLPDRDGSSSDPTSAASDPRLLDLSE